MSPREVYSWKDAGRKGCPRMLATYLYRLVDPRDGAVRYVGASVNPELRYRAHIARSPYKAAVMLYWVEHLRAAGVLPRMEVFMVVPPGEDWRAAESEQIRLELARGSRLVNRQLELPIGASDIVWLVP